ncbi:hypothetical protein DPMN_139341 [Dreissena polymorpha]|uniref:Uncharacterized protein n=1 Tax=Dreissena polymorpha TaxID=45954 RepID=A0A9D4G645_DREPO|nr:hypothetical protein DPMN_139341 [Dreissena polymorpha]
MVSDIICEPGREHAQAPRHCRRTAVGHEGMVREGGAVEPIRPEKRRAMIQSEVRRAEENARQARAVEMGAQGAWTTWNNRRQEVDVGRHLEYEPFRFPFSSGLSMTYYHPQRTCADGTHSRAKMQLCDRVGTLEHVLSSCSTALTQGKI